MDPFVVVLLRISSPYTMIVYGLDLPQFISADGRLRPCLFDRGIVMQKLRLLSVYCSQRLVSLFSWGIFEK